MSRFSTTLGIVLSRRNIAEADRILTVYTQSFGKLAVRARGVRRITSKRIGHIELFNTIRVQLVEGKSGVRLAQTELVRDRSSLKKHLKLLRIAYHLAELVDRLTPEYQPHPEVFALLDRALSSVTLKTWEQEPRLVSAFERKLLSLLGFGVPSGEDTEFHIERLIERRLVSRRVLSDADGVTRKSTRRQ